MRRSSLIALVVAAAPLTAQDPVADGAVHATFERWARESRIAGVAVGRLRDGATTVITAGMIRVGAPAPITDSTTFEIGSITKALTGTLLADMVLRREVHLSDPVQLHLPEGWIVPAHPSGRAITLLDLATHTSGLPPMPADFAPSNAADPYADYTDAKLRASLASASLSSVPGTAYGYSNFGAAILGRAIAHRGGRSYEALLRERVLRPLGMYDTRFADEPGGDARAATGHTSTLEPASAWTLVAFAPAGGLRSTVRDMLKLASAVADTTSGPLRGPLAFAIRAQRPVAGADSVGLGWHRLRRGTSDVVWHNGGTGGFRSWIGVAPDRRRAVVVLANMSAGWVDATGTQLLRDAALADPSVARFIEATVAMEALERYVGRYELAPEFILAVTREGTTMSAQATGQPRINIRARSATVFAAPEFGAELTFEIDATGAVTGVTLRQGGQVILGRRLASVP